MILRPYLVGKLPKVHLHFPTNVFPVLAGVPEFQRLRTFPAREFCNPNSEDSVVNEGEDRVAECRFTHRLIKRISRAVGVALGRPEILALDLAAASLVLVNAPVAHIYGSAAVDLEN
jgi:hypothetical protein